MGLLSCLGSLAGSVFVATYLNAISVSASPSINVALKTSFSSSPYLLELLETAAEEDETTYVPLLNHIADGAFAHATTDRDLYDSFLNLIVQENLMPDPAVLSSYKLALSLHASAPRIEAHYQYYHTAVEPKLLNEEQSSCPTWVAFGDKQYCSPELDKPHGQFADQLPTEALAFDRVIGNASAPVSILYADLTSPTFGVFHKTLIKTAREHKTSYRVRYRRPLSPLPASSLVVSGYGVELALKRTDYIVIDDREKEGKSDLVEKISLEDKDVGADLKPLSKSELLRLGLKSSSFVMQSENPLDALLRLSEDFPKYSGAMAAYNVSSDFRAEHNHNREVMLLPGNNVMWMNGLQLTDRQIDAFTLLDLMRKERKLISQVQAVGITAAEAVKLLSHEKIAKPAGDGGPARYLWSDQNEGGNVILWLNDIEKDVAYESWPVALNALLQRTYPGQLPTVRRNIHNLIIPIDFTKEPDVQLVIGQLQAFVERRLPLRFGIVPITSSKASSAQTKVVYFLQETYGLPAALEYLGKLVSSKDFPNVSKSAYEAVISDRSPQPGQNVVLDVKDVLSSEEIDKRIKKSQQWVDRLSADTAFPILFANGALVPRSEDWLQAMSGRVFSDLQLLQRAVYEETVDQTSWIPGFFLDSALSRRNSLITPEDEASIKMFNMDELKQEHPQVFATLPQILGSETIEKPNWAHVMVVADLSTIAGQKLLSAAEQYQKTAGIEVSIIDNSASAESMLEFYAYLKDNEFPSFESFKIFQGLEDHGRIVIRDKEKRLSYRDGVQGFFRSTRDFVDDLGLEAGEQALLVNGRLVGPIPDHVAFGEVEFEYLLAHERKIRINPAYEAMQELGLSDRIEDQFDMARLSSVVAVCTQNDVPVAIYEQASSIRISDFDKLQYKHTAIEVGDVKTATIQFVASVDPASELAQRWIPILKVLSGLDGVYMKLFLNPVDRLKELPVKRFYRYVLDAQPTFTADGVLEVQSANFAGVPQEALLTLGMHVAPAWLVAAKETIHDLDNIKLSNVHDDIRAVYELEHILIEGHSREVPGNGGNPPRGVQLVLGTDKNPLVDDTIIMANLGYFQFKANPGYYHISLQEGRSAEIFDIESLGAFGWLPRAGDETTDIVLMSFQGATLYPRLARKPGHEEDDVLDAKASSKIKQRLKSAQSILGFGNKGLTTAKNADINIFSVASGHLYERMLNIMMVSVMKHTKHTVKFWFIEQFLSPSFKDFIPHLAAEYGFEYEMVTYKWPHWLRGQTEKQREIWGYKILFLDVLFPLSLDKVIFVDADQIVRTDMIELVNHDLEGAPYGFTPMCDSRTSMEGFRFWKQGYWKNFLRGLPYHISALYVVDLKAFRQMAAGDRLRQQYHQLSADPGSLSNLDQDLPNHMQSQLRIHSLPQDWLWCETWCSDEALATAKTIDLCNNPETKEPKLDRARRQVPEWTVYDDEIANVDRKRKGDRPGGEPIVAERNPKIRSIAIEKDEL